MAAPAAGIDVTWVELVGFVSEISKSTVWVDARAVAVW